MAWLLPPTESIYTGCSILPRMTQLATDLQLKKHGDAHNKNATAWLDSLLHFHIGGEKWEKYTQFATRKMGHVLFLKNDLWPSLFLATAYIKKVPWEIKISGFTI